jgi:hypothetical protein
MQIASFLRRIKLYPRPVLLYRIFPRYHIKGKIFPGEKIEHNMWILIFSATFSETLLIARRIQQNIINIHMFPCKVPVIRQILIQINIFKRFSKRPKIPNFIKIHFMAAELLHANKPDKWTGRSTDMTK